MSLIELENVTKTIGKVEIIKNINITLNSPSVIGFQGINGSGKTMLLRLICGLILPTKGCVKIDGQRLGVDLDFPKSIGALIESPGFIGHYSGYQNLKLLTDLNTPLKAQEINATLLRVGLAIDNKKYRKYSLGMKQRLGIAAAIIGSPEIIILDEPTNALDTEGIDMLQNIIIEEKTRGAIILISSHDKDFITKIADEIYVLKQGAIFQHII